MKAMVSRSFWFLGVGVISSAGYLATMSLGVDWLALSVFASAFLAFCVGTALSYVGNTLFTFRRTMTGETFWRFLAVVLAGLGLNQALAYALDRAGAHYVFIALAVFVTVPVINFLGHSFFTYREEA